MDGVPSPIRAQDHWHVNIGEPWEVTFWTNEFGCSEEELRRAVEAVGPIAGRVRAHILLRNQQQTD